ncbi:MAG: 50S ribosomal protein L13 [Candidatus Aenigmarchaeota archaeon]|nr:50S ribosomal protein L13 [Candidatus Aenigmarchaeota archaeon]
MAEIIIDGTNAIMGRLASSAAKDLLKGEKVHIVNAERIIITGDRLQIINDYLERRRRGSPHHGPFFPTRPDMIIRRCIRGMLPYKTNKGRKAFKNLRVSASIPDDIKDAKTAAKKRINCDFVTVGEVAKALGWRNT